MASRERAFILKIVLLEAIGLFSVMMYQKYRTIMFLLIVKFIQNS